MSTVQYHLRKTEYSAVCYLCGDGCRRGNFHWITKAATGWLICHQQCLASAAYAIGGELIVEKRQPPKPLPEVVYWWQK